MSERWEYEQEACREELFEELGPEWAEEHGFAPYEDAIRDFTAAQSNRRKGFG